MIELSTKSHIPHFNGTFTHCPVIGTHKYMFGVGTMLFCNTHKSDIEKVVYFANINFRTL